MARIARRYAIVHIVYDKRRDDIYADLIGVYRSYEAAIKASEAYSFMTRNNDLMLQTVKVVLAPYFNE